MVFQFEHVGLDHGDGKFDPRPLDLRDLKRSLGRWQDALAEKGWNSLYWNNHDQPRIVSRFGDDGEFRVQSAKMLGTVLHLHRGTPYVYQGEELGMANVGFTGVDQLRDIESVNHYRTAVAAGRTLPRCSTRSAGWAATTRARRCSGTPGRRRASRPASRGSGQPGPRGRERRGAGRRPGLGVPPLPPADRAAAPGAGRRPRRLHDAPARAPRRTSSPGRTTAVELLVLGNFSGETLRLDLPDGEAWAGAEVLIGNYDAVDDVAELRPLGRAGPPPLGLTGQGVAVLKAESLRESSSRRSSAVSASTWAARRTGSRSPRGRARAGRSCARPGRRTRAAS